MSRLVSFRTDPRSSLATRPRPLGLARWDMDDLFDRFLGDFWGHDARANGSPAVRTELSETDEHIRVRAEVPGVAPEDLNVSLTGDVLTLSGEKRSESESESGPRTYSERSYGAFQRSIQLPCHVDPDEVEATHKNGVVTIELKKAESVRAKRIEVKASRASK